MQQQENRFLFNKKVYLENKDERLAIEEIKDLEESQKQFKLLYHENERNIKAIEKLNKTIKELVSKNFTLKFELAKRVGSKDTEKKAEVKKSNNHVLRIIRNMELNREYGKIELARELCMPPYNIDTCFLIISKCKEFNYEITSKGKYKRI